MKNNSIPAFRDVEERLQTLNTCEIAFHDLRFLRDEFLSRIVGKYERSYSVSLINQLTAHGASKETGRTGHEVQRVLIHF